MTYRTSLIYRSNICPIERSIFYIINSDPVLGALGYVNSAMELVRQAKSKNIDLKHVFIENTYNSKVFAAMFDFVQSGNIKSNEAVCCYNTGGTPALFGSKIISINACRKRLYSIIFFFCITNILIVSL